MLIFEKIARPPLPQDHSLSSLYGFLVFDKDLQEDCLCVIDDDGLYAMQCSESGKMMGVDLDRYSTVEDFCEARNCTLLALFDSDKDITVTVKVEKNLRS